jgi:hypothetical protein
MSLDRGPAVPLLCGGRGTGQRQPACAELEFGYVESASMTRLRTASGTRKIVLLVFVSVVTAASLVVTATTGDIANWLDARVGAVGIFVGGGLIFTVTLWIASKLD